MLTELLSYNLKFINISIYNQHWLSLDFNEICIIHNLISFSNFVSLLFIKSYLGAHFNIINDFTASHFYVSKNEAQQENTVISQGIFKVFEYNSLHIEFNLIKEPRKTRIDLFLSYALALNYIKIISDIISYLFCDLFSPFKFCYLMEIVRHHFLSLDELFVIEWKLIYSNF
jgi:hypothetical protein